jgi:hypothetical protein
MTVEVARASLHGNNAATAFWRAVVPNGYAETVTEEGPVQRFTI